MRDAQGKVYRENFDRTYYSAGAAATGATGAPSGAGPVQPPPGGWGKAKCPKMKTWQIIVLSTIAALALAAIIYFIAMAARESKRKSRGSAGRASARATPASSFGRRRKGGGRRRYSYGSCGCG